MDTCDLCGDPIEADQARMERADPPAVAHEPDRGGEPGEPGADHVDDRHRAQSSP